jgi:hypothetical protein
MKFLVLTLAILAVTFGAPTDDNEVDKEHGEMSAAQKIFDILGSDVNDNQKMHGILGAIDELIGRSEANGEGQLMYGVRDLLEAMTKDDPEANREMHNVLDDLREVLRASDTDGDGDLTNEQMHGILGALDELIGRTEGFDATQKMHGIRGALRELIGRAEGHEDYTNQEMHGILGAIDELLSGDTNKMHSPVPDQEVQSVMEILGQIVERSEGYDRTCVPNLLRTSTNDDDDDGSKEVTEREKIEITAATILCIPDRENKAVAIMQGISAGMRKQVMDEEGQNGVECLRKKLMELDPESPLVTEDVPHGTCNDHVMEKLESAMVNAAEKATELNKKVDEDCPMVGDMDKFKMNFVRTMLVVIGNNSEDVKEAEMREIADTVFHRIEDVVECIGKKRGVNFF